MGLDCRFGRCGGSTLLGDVIGVTTLGQHLAGRQLVRPVTQAVAGGGLVDIDIDAQHVVECWGLGGRALSPAVCGARASSSQCYFHGSDALGFCGSVREL